jgi:NADH:ubiquinone oxidoreductase subunit 6 (subunit J)
MPEEEKQRFGMPARREEPMAPTGDTQEDEVEAARMANRFDIRRLIGAVFVLYGLILLALGIFGSHAVKTKAAGININLWTGIGMLIFGALMIFWALARPVEPEPEETRGQGSGRIRRAPAT